ncbi:hypothetical protein BSLG_002579 [Batrachochytrium salamandrivorans]|nr:hypothetical protein BSLG_002579 [Batrachochytrium salamandrivorans]
MMPINYAQLCHVALHVKVLLCDLHEFGKTLMVYTILLFSTLLLLFYPRHSWELLRELVRFKITSIIQERTREDSTISQINPTVSEMEERIMEALDLLPSAPFTLQRLCELITQPLKDHKSFEKYLRAVEKVLSVSSYTIDCSYLIVSESGREQLCVLPDDGQVPSEEIIPGSLPTHRPPVSQSIDLAEEKGGAKPVAETAEDAEITHSPELGLKSQNNSMDVS